MRTLPCISIYLFIQGCINERVPCVTKQWIYNYTLCLTHDVEGTQADSLNSCPYVRTEVNNNPDFTEVTFDELNDPQPLLVFTGIISTHFSQCWMNTNPIHWPKIPPPSEFEPSPLPEYEFKASHLLINIPGRVICYFKTRLSWRKTKRVL